MMTTRREAAFPLPVGWPRRVRSVAVHAISFAQASLTAARGWAANSWDTRVRLQEENDRLRQEIHLLLEELRIKDARLARIPAQRRPHYPPTERLAILELRTARGWSLSQTATRLLVTPRRHLAGSHEGSLPDLPSGPTRARIGTSGEDEEAGRC